MTGPHDKPHQNPYTDTPAHRAYAEARENGRTGSYGKPSRADMIAAVPDWNDEITWQSHWGDEPMPTQEEVDILFPNEGCACAEIILAPEERFRTIDGQKHSRNLCGPEQTKEVQKWADVAMWSAPAHSDPQKPIVTLSCAPEDPLGVMAMVNGMYTGKVYRTPADVSDAERREAWEAATVSLLSQAPLEWFQVSILFENVTRAFTHQLVRTRLAGYAQESMRFAVKEDAGDAVKLPPSLEGTVPDAEFRAQCEADGVDPDINRSQAQNWRSLWDHTIETIAENYNYLIEDGMPAEHARGLLPTNVLTRVHQHIDLGSLKRMAGNRLCTQAQFEWRAVFIELARAFREYLPKDHPNRWQYELIAASFRPVCYSANKCTMKAKSDRYCAIRERVDANEEAGRKSDDWETPLIAPFDSDGVGIKVLPIFPVEWLLNEKAARVAR